MNVRGLASFFLFCLVVAFIIRLHLPPPLPPDHVEIIEPEDECYIVRAYHFPRSTPGRKVTRVLDERNRHLFDKAVADLERKHGRRAATFVVILPVRLPDGTVTGKPMEMMVLFRQPGLGAPINADGPVH